MFHHINEHIYRIQFFSHFFNTFFNYFFNHFTMLFTFIYILSLIFSSSKMKKTSIFTVLQRFSERLPSFMIYTFQFMMLCFIIIIISQKNNPHVHNLFVLSVYQKNNRLYFINLHLCILCCIRYPWAFKKQRC